MKKRRFKTVYTHPSGVLFMAALTILLIANLCGCAGPKYEFDPVEETQWALIVEQTISAQMTTAEANMTSTAAQAIIETKSARATAAALATPTNTPTNTPIPRPNISAVKLKLNDVQPGFEAYSDGNQYFTIYREKGYAPETVFGFNGEPNPSYLNVSTQYIRGFTTLLLTQIEQDTFDSDIHNTRYILEPFVTEKFFETNEITLPEHEPIGDASVKITALGSKSQQDFIAFRRGVVGVFISVLSMFEPPTIKVEEIAQILDDRIIESLSR